MTTSGIINFQPTTLEILEWAFNNLGIAQEGEPLTPRMYSDGLRSLNGLLQTFSANPHLWTATENTLALVAGQAAYVVSPRALRVTNCRYRRQGIETPMTEMSRQEYLDQPNKTISPAIPVSFYFDPKVDIGTLYLWPPPSAQTVAQGYDIRYDYIRFFDVQTASNETLDLPSQWIEPVVWNLSKRLMTQYPVNDPNVAALVLSQAADTLADLLAWDNEPASLFLQADYDRTGYGGYYRR